jgi:D-glycero-D-manno-heptose 1,7-bisphosphate phosphatase
LDNSSRYIVLDRDGVINVDLFDYVRDPKEFEFEHKSVQALKKLSDKNVKIVVLTNQACVSHKTATEEMINNVHDHMKNELKKVGADIELILFCPHANEDNCECRKPKTGLLEKAEAELGISLKIVFLLVTKNLICLLQRSMGVIRYWFLPDMECIPLERLKVCKV